MDVLGDALKQGIAPAIVVAIYLIIIKIIDNKKENVQIKISAELTQSINNISTFLTDITKNIVDKDKDKCKIAIEDAMFSSGMRIINFVSTTIVNNQVDLNRENVIANIHHLVNSEYYSVFSTLSLYKVNGVKASNYLNKDWMAVIEKDMTDSIFNSSLNKEARIISFSNKISIKFQSYITYIINNVIK